MIKAVIDLGTNTFNLLVGEIRNGKLKIIHAERSPVMLGMDGINSGYIVQEAYDRAMRTLRDFKEKALNLGAQEIKGFGTSAIREARNGQEFIDKVRIDPGIEIEVISGLFEGELIYKGVGLSHDFTERSVIMDIGGGSTEFVLVDTEGMKQVVSLKIGVSRIYQYLSKPPDYREEEQREVLRYIEETTLNELDGFSSRVLVGASGAFETFYELAYKRPFPMDGRAHEIDKELLMSVLYWSIHSTLKEREENPWVIEMRKRMLPVGALKIRWTIEKLGIDTIYVSPYSLKEGALIS